jgi:hypothetical protein
MTNTPILPHIGLTRGVKPHTRYTRQEGITPPYGALQAKQGKAAVIAGRLLEAAGKIRYGSAAVVLKIHDGRVTDVTYNVTESTRERWEEDE